MRTRVLIVAGAFAIVLAANRADASGGGGYLGMTVQSSMHTAVIDQQPGETWDFWTTMLSAGADTVIHVQDWGHPQAVWVAGNDDWGGSVSSFLHVSATSQTRQLLVVVRAYSNWTQGECDFHAASSLGRTFNWYDVPVGGDTVSLPALDASTHILTTQYQGGAKDTIMLAIPEDAPEHAIAFDDDDGLDLMSKIILPTACGSGWTRCNVVIGHWNSASPPGFVGGIYDEDTESVDSDADGLGDGFELNVGLNRLGADTDQDGIDDYEETVGIDDPSQPVKFPFMGASATQKDIFVEVDWVECRDTFGNPCSGGLDRHQLTSEAQMALFVDRYMAYQVGGNVDEPRAVRVHLDVGAENTDPTTWTQWGNWEGANRLTTNTCSGLNPARVGKFHLAISGEGEGATPGQSCFNMHNNASSGSHELGHGFGLDHGAAPTSTDINCKPSYVSPMNYAYQSAFGLARTFSSGQLASLNPAALTERSVPLPPAVIENLVNDWSFNVDTVNGWVDWNRDGVFAPAGTTVRGAPTSTPGRHDCGGSLYGDAQLTGVRALRDVSLAWQTVSVGSIGDRLLIVGRNGSGYLNYMRAPRTALQACDNFFSTYRSHMDCAGIASLQVFGPNIATSRAPAVVQQADGPVLVITVSGNRLWATNFTTNGLGTDTWYGTTQLPGNVPIDGDPAVYREPGSGAIFVWAPSNGRLKLWTKMPSASWNLQGDESWVGGTFVNPSVGIAVVSGYLAGDAAPSIFAAIPTTPSGQIDFARRVGTTWTSVGSFLLQGAYPVTKARPGLAYVPWDVSSPSTGRFYMSWNQPDVNGAPVQGLFAMTQGNDPNFFATAKRLDWLPVQTLMGLYAPPAPGTALMFDAARDTHLRSAATLAGNAALYVSPLADGVVNTNLRDFDDYTYLRSYMQYALHQAGFSGPPQ